MRLVAFRKRLFYLKEKGGLSPTLITVDQIFYQIDL